MFTNPTVRIADAIEGDIVTVRGRVIPRDLIDSPLSGQRCVYYRFRSERWRRSRVAGVGGDGFWEALESDEAIVEFYVADESGQAIVSPSKAEVKHVRGRGHSTTIPMVIEGIQRAHEQLIVTGDEVTVTGEAAWADDLFDEGRDYRQPTRRLMLRAPAGKSLQITLLRPDNDASPQ